MQFCSQAIVLHSFLAGSCWLYQEELGRGLRPISCLQLEISRQLAVTITPSVRRIITVGSQVGSCPVEMLSELITMLTSAEPRSRWRAEGLGQDACNANQRMSAMVYAELVRPTTEFNQCTCSF